MPKFLPDSGTYIQGNIQKLVQVAKIEGDLIIVSEKASMDALKPFGDKTPNHWGNQKYKQQTLLFEETSELINIVIFSKRFGKKIRLKVPLDMEIWAVRDILVETLNLPRHRIVEELGIGFEFTYTLATKAPLENKSTLRKNGVTNGTELQLLIDVLVDDPHVRELESRLHHLSRLHFSEVPTRWGWIEQRKRGLEREIHKLQEKLHNIYANNIFDEPFFDYLGHQLETR